MRYSRLFGKTIKDTPKDETAINAKLLTRGGFIRREVAGVYNYLPLGLLVLNKIANIVRDEMNKADSQEIFLSALQNKASWEKTGRWQTFDALFKLKSILDTEYALGPTHEEVLVPLVRQFVSSYKDLPLSLYQIQTKFRDEKRAKSGILRGREFLMKDCYSFHSDEEDFNKYYETIKRAYKNIYKRCGLDAIETQASGGAFGEFSHEYQVITAAGEDEIIYCPGGDFSANAEISPVKEGKECDLGHGKLLKAKAIEVGNIFPLKTKFSDAFGLMFKDKSGINRSVIMGCYGIGISRLMGAIAEIHNDERGIVWPKTVAPRQAHLIMINDEGLMIKEKAEGIYEKLLEAGIEVLYDDRADVSAGTKFADADLIGIHVRLVVSAKLLDKIEWKYRSEKETEIIELDEAVKRLRTVKTE